MQNKDFKKGVKLVRGVLSRIKGLKKTGAGTLLPTMAVDISLFVQ